MVTARVDLPTFRLIDGAAQLRGIHRQKVIIAGAVAEAQRIMAVATETVKAHRLRIRKARSLKSQGAA